MPKIEYQHINFSETSLEVIRRANEILADYERQGYDLTLRQLYYQFVSKGWIENKDTSYKRLGSIINDARLAGLVDWERIEDRTRNLQGNSHWGTPADMIEAAERSFKIDLWKDQPYRVEVWVEKEALAGVIERSARRLDVNYFSCRGYVSQSEMWQAGQRLAGYQKAGQKPVIIHLGDHDPSGIDMSRDISDRLWMFMGGPRPLDVRRIALNMDQVERYSPPPNPAKVTDSRATDYIDRFGSESWELDALDPATLDGLITGTVTDRYLDAGLMDARKDLQAEMKRQLTAVRENWDAVKDFLLGPIGPSAGLEE